VSTQLVDTTEPSEEAIFSSRNLLVYVPGVLLLIAVGLLGKYAQIGWKSLARQEHWTVPDAETTATGYLYSEQAGKIAVLVKSTRNALIGFVVLGFALYWASRGQADHIAPGLRARASFIWEKFPKFVLGFLAVSAIATAGWLSKGQSANIANVSKWAFLLTFAGVGLNTNIRELVRTGWRPLLVAVVGLVVVAAVSLGLVLLTSRVFGWGIGAGTSPS
jgi:uncharacterized membrane protein YadS